MSDIHLLLVGGSLALSMVIALLVMRDRSMDACLRWLILGMVLAGAAYSLLLGQPGDPWNPTVYPLLRLCATLGTVWLWLAARLLFDDSFTLRRVHLLAPAILAVAVAMSWWRVVAVLAAALALHLLWLLLFVRRDDLDEYRRRLRLLLAGAGSAYVLIALSGHLLAWRSADPMAHALWLLSAQVLFKSGWLLLTIGHPSPVVRLYDTTHRAQPPVQQALRHSIPIESDRPEARDAGLGGRILDAMERDRFYRRTGLSIAALAAHVRLPEHRVRRLISQQLGFRNFTAFVNHFRLREVATRLQDPRDAHLPVTTLALDAGYGSLGPFNRAFRDAFGVTPTEFRRQPASSAVAES